MYLLLNLNHFQLTTNHVSCVTPPAMMSGHFIYPVYMYLILSISSILNTVCYIHNSIKASRLSSSPVVWPPFILLSHLISQQSYATGTTILQMKELKYIPQRVKHKSGVSNAGNLILEAMPLPRYHWVSHRNFHCSTGHWTAYPELLH